MAPFPTQSKNSWVKLHLCMQMQSARACISRPRRAVSVTSTPGGRRSWTRDMARASSGVALRLSAFSFVSSLAAAYRPGVPLQLRRAGGGSSSALPFCAAQRQIRCAATQAPAAGKPEAAAVAPVVLPTNDNSDDLLKIRHTSAHLMAMAVQKLFKDAKVTIGPWIEKGFYYDFDCPTAFADKDLRRIKKEMDKLIQMKLPLVREEVSEEEARRRIEEQNEPYKLEILDSIVAREPGAPPLSRSRAPTAASPLR